MTSSSYKQASSDIRRLLNYSFIERSGHFGRLPVRLSGRLNNHWRGIFNIKADKVIALYKQKNGVMVMMYRKKSPYSSLLNELLRRQPKVHMVLSKRIPKSVELREVSRQSWGMRPETKSQRKEANRKLGMLYKATIHDPRRIRSKVREAKT